MKETLNNIKWLMLIPCFGCILILFIIDVKFCLKEKVVTFSQQMKNMFIVGITFLITEIILLLLCALIHNYFISIPETILKYIEIVIFLISGYMMTIPCNRYLKALIEQDEKMTKN